MLVESWREIGWKLAKCGLKNGERLTENCRHMDHELFMHWRHVEGFFAWGELRLC